MNLASCRNPTSTTDSADEPDIVSRKSVATLSTSGQRENFHRFLIDNGLTSKSANSYCSYLNNLCKNITASSQQGPATDAFSSLEAASRDNKTEDDFLRALAPALAGPHGRANDLGSAAKQFYRFGKGGY